MLVASPGSPARVVEGYVANPRALKSGSLSDKNIINPVTAEDYLLVCEDSAPSLKLEGARST